MLARPCQLRQYPKSHFEAISPCERLHDHAIYRIRLIFKSDGYYEAELANLRNETADIDGIVITNDDSQHLVHLSFLNRKTLRKFREEIDIGFMPSQPYEFKEFRRNRKGQWVFVTKPILWDEDRLR